MARARDCHKHGHELKQRVVTVTATKEIEIASMLNHAVVPPGPLSLHPDCHNPGREADRGNWDGRDN